MQEVMRELMRDCEASPRDWVIGVYTNNCLARTASQKPRNIPKIA